MNRKEYNSDTRYAKVLEQMDLLGIMDISTTRQAKNGTITWKLPLKNYNSGKTNIEVASFASGYVRNNNSGYSNYQLNKRYEGDPEYFKDYEYKNGKQVWTGKYRAFTTKKCKLIPIEIDRLEYLISYCLKNYYIKHANQVTDGEYVPKWKYNNLRNELDYQHDQYDGDTVKIGALKHELYNHEQRGNGYKEGYEHKKQYIKDLENKLDTIKRIASYGETE